MYKIKKISKTTALNRLNLALQEKGQQVKTFKDGSNIAKKLGVYYIINFITNEMVDFSHNLTPWMKNEFIIAPWEELAGEENIE
ncbi:hypothetical protein ACRQPR_004204 [Citrobacter amalonaticus]|uniref:hypothetical protein n=1 Tax=Citrobacter farmeri TaxID=67824 RepID=UPI00050E8D1D|nr:hypothetical protein [Citrobacter farmeri]MDB2166953.1 hypothetical protein [Citrobacter farmeri]QXA99839.1 hypothetical protein I6L53_23260 [Citrobacter farmeri]GAL51785.1 hypothetical protein CIFAM_22_00550 [Citrobacter farmeri GTC 1319]